MIAQSISRGKLLVTCPTLEVLCFLMLQQHLANTYWFPHAEGKDKRRRGADLLFFKCSVAVVAEWFEHNRFTLLAPHVFWSESTQNQLATQGGREKSHCTNGYTA